ncbi:hypothetical protein QVD17_34160 [Tagetes erecta]|uniref:Uncharacterized protein n=1 Tax=Tagetes erecta TaxID=13708 RepID=A0AAD8K0A5_TARER|nr:hypothetical protein QVD17_34160 [Tagetes erecta]
MLENTTDSSSTATVKRYAPPNQRNRALGRRKSGGGDRLERASSYGNEGEKNQAAGLRNAPIMDHADPPRLVGLQGCCNSEAYQLLNNRWAAAMSAYESPSTDLAERPVMYTGSSASAWGQFRLPHQMISPIGGGPSGPQMDFISELRQAMHNSNAQF